MKIHLFILFARISLSWMLPLSSPLPPVNCVTLGLLCYLFVSFLLFEKWRGGGVHIRAATWVGWAACKALGVVCLAHWEAPTWFQAWRYMCVIPAPWGLRWGDASPMPAWAICSEDLAPPPVTNLILAVTNVVVMIVVVVITLYSNNV